MPRDRLRVGFCSASLFSAVLYASISFGSLFMMKGSEHKKSLLLNYYADEKTEE